MQILPEAARPSAWKLLLLWGMVGLQSFGGGASTMLLIRRTFIEKNQWISDEEFIRFWSLCAFTPGINIVALTILIGRKLGGTAGIIASLAGLLLPSATITCLFAAAFDRIQHVPAIQAILHGVIPATAGIMFLVGVDFVRPLFKQSRTKGLLWLFLCLCFIVACAAVVIFFNASVIPVLLGAALFGIVVFRNIGRNPGDPLDVASSAAFNSGRGDD